jgi:hypothetical protein
VSDSKVLRQHVIDMHGEHIRVYRRKTVDIARDHAERHYRYAPNHYHAGPNTGPSNRPPGWYTGEDAVLIHRGGRV